MSEWRSCFTCLGKVCGCRKRSKKNGKVGDINFSVTNDIKVEVTTQGDDYGVNDVFNQKRHTPLCTHKGNLKVGEETLEQTNPMTEKVQGIYGKLELKHAGSSAPSETKAEGVVKGEKGGLEMVSK